MAATPTTPPDSSSFEALAATAALLDALPWGVLVLDEQRVVRHLNQQAAHWCGNLASALVGQPLAEAALPQALSSALLPLVEQPAETPPREVWLPHAQ